MTDKQCRVLKFVLNRKRPVTAAVVAQQFSISQSTAAKHLRRLYIAGHLTKTQTGKKILWAETTTSMPVAVSNDNIIVQPPIKPTKPIWPDNPFKTSYPHVRGYDD